jgi:hypothetical protein
VPPAAQPSANAVARGSSTGIEFNLAMAAGSVTFPPARLSCLNQGRSFTMRGPFGVDDFVLTAAHLQPGLQLGFNFTQTFLTSLTLTISGPSRPLPYYAGPVRTGAGQSVTQGTGTSSVSGSGTPRRLNLTLERQTRVCPPPRPPGDAPGRARPASRHSPTSGLGVRQPGPAPELRWRRPLTCYGGAVNVFVWQYLQNYDPQVQALGAAATVALVEEAFCPPALSAYMPAVVALEACEISAD